MTKKEALKSIIQVYVDDNTLDLALLTEGIDGTLDVTPEDVNPLELAAIPVLQSLLSVSSESEGAQSISYDREGIKQRLLFLAEKHGLKEIIRAVKGNPKVTQKIVW